MSLILNIDTALETASICLADEGKVKELAYNNNQKDHAEWLQTAIKKIIADSGYSLKELSAIAVTIGPGSYTGLRVGLASAKGLCYALNIPLITLNTLKVMAAAASRHVETELLCPLIDARRMEVYMAVYTKSLQEIMKPSALILESDSFSELLSSHKILFFGNGCIKAETLISNNNAAFKNISYSALDMALLAQNHLSEQNFADLAYVEPEYLKDFFYPSRKSSL